MSARLEIAGLHVAYGQAEAVAVERLVVEPGTLAGVIGANGAGKSTLINAVANWSRAEPRIAGSVRLDGEELAGLSAEARVRRGLQLVPEGRGVFLGLSVEENLKAVARPGGAQGGKGGRSYAVEDVYALFPRLRERRANLAGSLSGGERQMLAVGRALRMAPKLLLLDEPSIGLAPRLVATLLATIRELVEGGLTVLLVEQNVHAAAEVTDVLHLLERGRVVAAGPVAEMRNDPRIVEAYLGASHG
ncbi:branched-chain amino acid transport system ATP-binding protein [Methylobacterium sp. 174MFSha1.1]|uniref:ABC transporter ATP-binding protein n=1 Tax=Methylobacterium sp. 174MFSha1.1 TaxID=1502749 RepID=UPI0008EF9932|nr:ABC transporter ATP-binding protein [Methylobacterium sp. 174MFSha1.1]SFU48502.1 branched-chain amino acid transport system ATP-binding protein [Methylobacterium sp. 174MFSha1.1]